MFPVLQQRAFNWQGNIIGPTTITVSDANQSSIVYPNVIAHKSNGILAPLAGFGAGVQFQLDNVGVGGGNLVEAGDIGVSWNIGLIATTMNFKTLNASGAIAAPMTLGYGGVDIFADNTNTAPYQIQIDGVTNPTESLQIGLNSSNHYGSIQYNQVGGSAGPLLLNPSGGNVGIGLTTAPAYLLQVNGSFLALSYTLNDNGSASSVHFTNGATARGDIGLAEGASQYATGSVAGDIIFRTAAGNLWIDTNNGSGTPSMKIASGNGAVSINNGLLNLTKYNGDTTAGNGLASNVGHVAQTGKTTAISNTAIFTPTADGLYLVNVYLEITTAGTGGTMNYFIAFADDIGSTTLSSALINANAQNRTNNAFVIHARTTVSIQYNVTFNSVTGSPVYSVFVDVVRLS